MRVCPASIDMFGSVQLAKLSASPVAVSCGHPFFTNQRDEVRIPPTPADILHLVVGEIVRFHEPARIHLMHLLLPLSQTLSRALSIHALSTKLATRLPTKRGDSLPSRFVILSTPTPRMSGFGLAAERSGAANPKSRSIRLLDWSLSFACVNSDGMLR